MTLSEFKQAFDTELEAEVSRRISETLVNVSDTTARALVEHILVLIRAGGKRVRPYLCTLSYLAFGGNSTQIKFIRRRAMALELFHVFALIHDDIIDRGAFRHGVPTVHELAKKILAKDARAGDIHHVANSHAIMIGDIVFSWAQSLWFEGYNDGGDQVSYGRAARYFIQMTEEVILGEMLDVDTTTRKKVSKKLILQKTFLKTATYTFTRPLHIGLAFASWSKEREMFCGAFGEALGYAFQMQDDFLDITGDRSKTAKPTLQDISEGQHTIFTDFIFSKGTASQKKFLRSCLGKKVSKTQEKNIVSLFHTSGALQYGERQIKKYFKKAHLLLEETKCLPLEYKKEFTTLVGLIEKRTS